MGVGLDTAFFSVMYFALARSRGGFIGFKERGGVSSPLEISMIVSSDVSLLDGFSGWSFV
jgi:hypothetical protein